MGPQLLRKLSFVEDIHQIHPSTSVLSPQLLRKLSFVEEEDALVVRDDVPTPSASTEAELR